MLQQKNRQVPAKTVPRLFIYRIIFYVFPALLTPDLTTQLGNGVFCNSDKGRTQFQFIPEHAAVAAGHPWQGRKPSICPSFSIVLVCLGLEAQASVEECKQHKKRLSLLSDAFNCTCFIFRIQRRQVSRTSGSSR